MQELVGMKIGPYQIQSRLASGGMANVYLARNVKTETEPPVAIKLVHTSIEDYCERFRREIRELSTIHHDHILPVVGYGEDNCWCYLATPYIEGGTLTRRLVHGPLSLQEATEIFSQLADALAYIHAQGIVHRDIKSSNVLMRDEHYAYLADFGLAKHVDLGASLTASSSLMVTPQYMAPELAQKDASPRSDIYALGILLYQMLTGDVPFKGDSPLDVCLKHIQQQPATPSVLNPAIPPEVELVVLHALAKNPDKRYQTVQDFNMAYQHALAQATARKLGRAAATTSFGSDTEKNDTEAHQASQQECFDENAHCQESNYPGFFRTTLPIPQVRLLKTAELRPQKVTLPRRQKQVRSFVITGATSLLLMLLLLGIAWKNTQQTSSMQLAAGPIIQKAHGKANPPPLLTPTSPMIPTFQPATTEQQNGENPSSNGDSGNNSGQDHGKERDHGKGRH